MDEVYKIFYPLIEKVKKVDVDEDSMNFIRAWWRTEVVVRFCEGDVVSLTGEVALSLLNDELWELGEGEYEYKAAFMMENLYKAEAPSIPSEVTDSSAEISLREKAAFNSIVKGVRAREKQSSLNYWPEGTTSEDPPTTLNDSTIETFQLTRETWRARASQHQQ